MVFCELCIGLNGVRDWEWDAFVFGSVCVSVWMVLEDEEGFEDFVCPNQCIRNVAQRCTGKKFCGDCLWMTLSVAMWVKLKIRLLSVVRRWRNYDILRKYQASKVLYLCCGLLFILYNYNKLKISYKKIPLKNKLKLILTDGLKKYYLCSSDQ